MPRRPFTEDHELFRDSVREFLRRHGPGITRDLWLAAGRQGFLELGLGEERDYRYQAVLIEELAKQTMALASSLSIHFDVVAPYLVELTTPEQRERWLPGVASGETVTAIGMTEPSAGSDLAALRTSAVRRDDGWVLNGSKTFITNGYSAGLVVVAARTTPGARGKGISLFVVERGMPGFTTGPKLDKVGQPEADTAELFFDDVWLPPGQLIGELDGGFAHMMQRLPQERIGAAVANIAHARQILDETIVYAGERHAFGQAIGSFQHNKFLLAELVTKADVTRAYVDQCVVAHAAGELTAVEAAKAKWWSAQTQNEILDHCVQLYGGYGYMNEQRVARAWKDARVTPIWAGSNEIMKELIGRDLGL
ncbi:acyl-CoA dehydrogenase family protein [Actinoplanes bogorensis]|uniref:Acyl-CoA dehydrogenase family protein n=1 Tax=Paractinoplanes bogorensis TaxID=1610840 RepID=A0ABS5YYL4_9ACTN|nr:acyl-CoA dehydrogenase family protein [Actinoplanes bogorensis]MBU2667200.1 acyl-CoA dehydrogenase family protein [Actinoplanes bogorensis]